MTDYGLEAISSSIDKLAKAVGRIADAMEKRLPTSQSQMCNCVFAHFQGMHAWSCDVHGSIAISDPDNAPRKDPPDRSDLQFSPEWPKTKYDR